MLAPTSGFRAYYDAIPADVLEPLPGWPHEEQVVALAREALERARGEPWGGAMRDAFQATARLRDTLTPFLTDYATDLADDTLPSLWGR